MSSNLNCSGFEQLTSRDAKKQVINVISVYIDVGKI